VDTTSAAERTCIRGTYTTTLLTHVSLKVLCNDTLNGPHHYGRMRSGPQGYLAPLGWKDVPGLFWLGEKRRIVHVIQISLWSRDLEEECHKIRKEMELLSHRHCLQPTLSARVRVKWDTSSDPVQPFLSSYLRKTAILTQNF